MSSNAVRSRKDAQIITAARQYNPPKRERNSSDIAAAIFLIKPLSAYHAGCPADILNGIYHRRSWTNSLSSECKGIPGEQEIYEHLLNMVRRAESDSDVIIILRCTFYRNRGMKPNFKHIYSSNTQAMPGKHCCLFWISCTGHAFISHARRRIQSGVV